MSSTKWIEEAISKKHIKYYKYKGFRNVKSISHGNFGQIYRANWKNSEEYFALKSLFKLDNDALRVIVNEVSINLVLPDYLIFQSYLQSSCGYIYGILDRTSS